MSITFLDNKGQLDEQIAQRIPGVIEPFVKEKREILTFSFGDLECVELKFPGIHIIYGDWKVREAYKIHMDIRDDEAFVEMHFTFLGKLEIQDDSSGLKHVFNQNQQNLFYMPGFTGHGVYHHENFKFFQIRFVKSYFLQLTTNSCPLLMNFADITDGSQIQAMGKINMPISFAMHQCLQDIMHCRFTGGLKLMYLQSKCVELLTLQAFSYETNASISTLACKSAYDQECIHGAKEYLLKHADHPPSLSELSKIVGLNVFKLKQGFKEIYQNTVYGYLNEYRLNEARQRLPHQPIKEIADNLGYSSVQHFTKAFKKKFGIPPGSAR